MLIGFQKTNGRYSVRAGVKAMALALFLILIIIPGCYAPDNNPNSSQPENPSDPAISGDSVDSSDPGDSGGNEDPLTPAATDGHNGNSIPPDPAATGDPGDNHPDAEDLADMIMIVEIRGEFDKDGNFHAFPWYTYESPRSSLPENPGGEYSARTYDDKGNQLAAAFFNPEYAIDHTRDVPPAPEDPVMPVRLALRFDREASKIVIFRGKDEVYSRVVSKKAPEVCFTGLADKQMLPNKTTITWEAAGAGELYFNLWYCPRETELHLIAADVTGSFYNADLTDFPGSRSGYFIIYATDGVRTTEAKSPLISTPFKAPDILTIQTEPLVAKITDDIFYNTSIFDVQDGWLSGSNISWLLDGEQISVGCALQLKPFRLPPGIYTCVCVATNSAGVSARKEYTVEIIDDESALPDDWSRKEIVYALTRGYTIPINRIESPVTRSEFAGLMYTLFNNIHPEGLPPFEKNVVTDCGENCYSEFLMVRLGVMEAPGGRFEPHKSLTQREAIRIIYQIRMLAQNPGLSIGNTAYDENKAVELFHREGILDKKANVYQPEEKMSKKLALVLNSRVDKLLFPDR